MEIFVIRQNVCLANGMNEWFDIDSHDIESFAWELLEKYKKTGFVVELVKRTETVISK